MRMFMYNVLCKCIFRKYSMIVKPALKTGRGVDFYLKNKIGKKNFPN